MMSRTAQTIAWTAAALLLAACSTAAGVTVSSGGTVTPTTATPSPSSSDGATDLTVTLDIGAGEEIVWHLTCDPPGGDHPDPEGACEVLRTKGEESLPPVPADRACTMIYGGPEKATITGTWRGEVVDSAFKRTNGCEIARWKSLVPLLPEAG